MTHHLRVAEFTRTPGGRFRADGPFSGEQYREDVLWPAIHDHGLVQVDLSGTMGYGSSFLEEVFGGIVRHHADDIDNIADRISLTPESSSYVKEARSYFQAALRKSGERKRAHA